MLGFHDSFAEGTTPTQVRIWQDLPCLLWQDLSCLFSDTHGQLASTESELHTSIMLVLRNLNSATTAADEGESALRDALSISAAVAGLIMFLLVLRFCFDFLLMHAYWVIPIEPEGQYQTSGESCVHGGGDGFWPRNACKMLVPVIRLPEIRRRTHRRYWHLPILKEG
jgi:hypothetical protein